jgi:hypothetical protein
LFKAEREKGSKSPSVGKTDLTNLRCRTPSHQTSSQSPDLLIERNRPTQFSPFGILTSTGHRGRVEASQVRECGDVHACVGLEAGLMRPGVHHALSLRCGGKVTKPGASAKQRVRMCELTHIRCIRFLLYSRCRCAAPKALLLSVGQSSNGGLPNQAFGACRRTASPRRGWLIHVLKQYTTTQE